MLYLIDPSNYHMHKNDLENMYRLRHKVFYEKLKWDVISKNGMEKDEYDEQNMYYLIYKDQQGIVRGTLRFVEMSNNCMFDGPFKFSLPDLISYKNSNYWELSRAVVDADYNETYTANIAKNIYVQLLVGLNYTLWTRFQNIKKCLSIAYPSVVFLGKKYGMLLHQISQERINNEDIIIFYFSPKDSYNNIVNKNFNPEYKPIIHCSCPESL